MAEFREVMKQWRRMCDKHQCADKQCGAVTYDLICPITISHNGYPCDSGFVDCSPESMAQVERIVMEWATENPEPVYPTWFEWLERQGVAGMIKGEPYYDTKDREIYLNQPAFTPKAFDHIPAAIAEKLGIEPKEE